LYSQQPGFLPEPFCRLSRQFLTDTAFRPKELNSVVSQMPWMNADQANNQNSLQIDVFCDAVGFICGYQGARKFGLARSLTAGTLYMMRGRAIGGLTDFSPWSDPISHMAM
jgi:hypothetical protein